MDELNGIIATVFQVPAESVPDGATAETVPNWDSIGHLNLVMALEERYAVRFTLEEIMAMRDVATIRRIVAERTGAPHP
jgi:acyl carrier protein